ncbi:uncharacterized protein V6R79_011975 [Siganus canaliculatus]
MKVRLKEDRGGRKRTDEEEEEEEEEEGNNWSAEEGAGGEKREGTERRMEDGDRREHKGRKRVDGGKASGRRDGAKAMQHDGGDKKRRGGGRIHTTFSRARYYLEPLRDSLYVPQVARLFLTPLSGHAVKWITTAEPSEKTPRFPFSANSSGKVFGSAAGQKLLSV